MSSTRNPTPFTSLTVVALAAAVLSGAGCQTIKPPRPDALSEAPLAIDPAMEARDWGPTHATYPSGKTVAGPNGLLIEQKANLPEYAKRVVEVPIVLANFALLPYTFAKTPPWSKQTYGGVTTPPTYTAQPPLPPPTE